MNLMKSIVGLACISASLYISRKLAWIFIERNIRKRRKERGIDYLMINKGLSFNIYPRSDCNISNHVKCTNLEKCNAGKLNYLLELMREAKYSLDVCVYLITSDVFRSLIINAKSRGVRVRIITDADYDRLSSYHQFYNCGIEVKMKSSDYIMHNKFVVIDGELLVMGSMNFTNSAVHSNWESMMVTSLPELVSQFSSNFDSIWRKSPI